ncbi:unnamed protein product, partial [Prunus brigantina]
GGSQVYKKWFVANQHRVTTEAQFQKWRAAYASAIYEDLHVKLTKPLTDDVPCSRRSHLARRCVGGGPLVPITYCNARIGEKSVGFPLPKILKDGSRMVQTLMIYLLDRRSIMLNLHKKGSLRDEATSSRAKNMSPLRKKPKLPSIEKTQVGVSPRHLPGLNIPLVQIPGR